MKILCLLYVVVVFVILAMRSFTVLCTHQWKFATTNLVQNVQQATEVKI